MFGIVKSVVFAGLFLALWGAQEVRAAASDWWRHDHGELRLIAASDAAGQAGTMRVGLHFRMRPGWKIYWRSPGDAGFPPRLTWAESENLADATVRWPAPERFKVLGLQTVGYKDEVVFPIDVTVFEPGKPVKLHSKIIFLTCSDVCVPHETELALTLPSGPETTSREAVLIEAYDAKVPGKGGDLRIDRAEVEVGDAGATLRVAIGSTSPLLSPDIFVESASDIFFGAPRVSRLGDGREALLTVSVKATKKDLPTLPGLPVTLTVVDGDRAVERKLTLKPVAAIVSAPSTGPPAVSLAVLVGMLGLAFVGGLILNLMPCVLPVLSIKLLSVVGHGGGDRRAVRAGFLASAAGIVTSFLVLATGAVMLRSAGLAAGWGIQFQQPVFLAAMIVILTLFACNMWGLFEFRLPGAVSDVALSAGTAGGGRTDDSGHGHGGNHPLIGHFMVGAFAALLATPCTAPFLGTAVGFALSQGPAEIYAVFAALGLGLGAPYLTVAAVPGLATRLPRPGHWMVTFRRVLGLALAATAVWLLTVLAAQIGYPLAGMVAILMAAIAVALWPIRKLPDKARLASWLVIAALGVFSVLVAVVGRDAPENGVSTASYGPADYWRPFDRVAIAEEVRRGRVVMVDVTADWCLTCKVNKGLVLDRDPVRSRLESSGVLAMQADWTRSSPEITAYLKSHGRYGIPFNIVYGPGTPKGEPLSEILTPGAVMAALDRASRGIKKDRASRGAVKSAAKR